MGGEMIDTHHQMVKSRPVTCDFRMQQRFDEVRNANHLAIF